MNNRPFCATEKCSRRGGTDKFARFNPTPILSKLVKPPVITECPINLECKVGGFHNGGDHDLFIGEVLLEHIDKDKVNWNGESNVDRLDPLIWLGSGFYRLGEKIGEIKWLAFVFSADRIPPQNGCLVAAASSLAATFLY